MTPLASDTPARPPSQRPDPGPPGLDAWGVVLCGGQSRRMGRDKARLVLGDRSLLERAVAVLAGSTPRVILATGRSPRYGELGLECVLDPEPDLGPLAGLAAALERLERAGVARACVLACDMPGVDAGVLARLLERARTSGADACLLATAAGIEPLCGVYHVRVLSAVRAALARGERRMNAFHGDIRLATLELGEPEADRAANLNTPEEFRAAGGRWA